MNMFVNDLILNACVKTNELFICEKIFLTTSGNKIYFQTNGDTTEALVSGKKNIPRYYSRCLFFYQKQVPVVCLDIFFLPETSACG